jgi:hypothetical protein
VNPQNGNLIERPQWYQIKIVNPTLTDGYSIQNIALQTDSDAPFRAFGIAFYVFDSSSVAQAAAGNIDFTIKFARPDGTTFFSRVEIPGSAIQPFNSQAPDGAGGQTAPYYSYFAPLSPNVLFPPQTTVTFNFTNLANVATARVYAVLCGCKLFRRGTVWAPTYPAKYTARPFEGFVVQIPTNSLPVYQQPFPSAPFLNADADFVWRSGAQTDNPPSALSPVGAFKGLGIKIYDPQQKVYMNDYVPLELIFGFDNSQTPGLVYPEIYIPRMQQIFFDLVAL